MVISPSSGPCDATVEVRGSGFEPGSQIPLDLGGAHSDVAIARLAVATAGPDGEFGVELTLGPLGCEEAARDTQLDDPGEPKNLAIFASYDPARLFVLAQAEYHYTTTAVSPQPHALPSTGTGPSDPSLPLAWLALAGPLAGVGLVLVVASLYRKRQHS
jgi:hypothetical protein